MKLFVHQFCHYEHINLLLAVKDRKQVRVRVNIAAVLLVLQSSFLNVRPQFLYNLCARQWF